MKSTRTARIFLLIGFACITVSTAGALFALHPRAETTGAKEKDSAFTVDPNGVVCYGYVDVDNGGVTPLLSLQSGRIVEVKARENAAVKKGDVLLRIDPALAEQRLREAKADLAAAESQLRQAEVLPKQHVAQLAQQKAAIEAAEKRAAAAQDALDQKQELLMAKQINKLLVHAATKLVDEARASAKVERQKLKQLECVDPTLQIARAKADADAKRARVEQAQHALNECVLKAPADGEILQVSVSEGSVLTGLSGTPAILFVAAKPRIVRAEVEQEFVGRLREGQAVTVKDEARRKESNITWTGKVQRISDWYTQRRSSSPDTLRISNNDVHVLECIIALNPAEQPPLRMGQRVRVSIGKN